MFLQITLLLCKQKKKVIIIFFLIKKRMNRETICFHNKKKSYSNDFKSKINLIKFAHNKSS